MTAPKSRPITNRPSGPGATKVFGGEALGPLSPQSGDRPLQELVVGQKLVDGVHAVTADGREDVVEHPRLER